jgi:DNA helicase-2/ATP-dependent DNA helicase PcrA
VADPFSLDDSAPPRQGGIAQRAMAAAGAPKADRYLSGLNPEQRRAVETLDGPVLVLAGAGTGKTRVLTTRIAHVITSGRAFPSQILAVTFTNKAAREMKERIGHLIGGVAEGMPWLGTFHSIGTKLLRRHAELVDLKSDFTILDTDDQIRLLKQVLQAADIDEKRWPARALAGMIDNWKNRGLPPAKVPAGEGMSFANGRGQELYAAYQARLKTLNACDFGDLLLETIRLLTSNPDVLKTYQDRFRYILVDEYQDTNVAQYLWLRLLAQGRRNVCCVGDDDQSIYGWRGAEVDNILRFEQDFPGATVIRLERNYRSTGHILATAAHLIAHNEERLGKTLFTDGDLGLKVMVAGSWDDEEEARQIGDEIESLQRNSHSLNEMAILVRTSAQMRVLEERLITLGVPYRVFGGPRFYERMEVRDALAYFRVVAQPADDLAFERIINTPKRGIGDATVSELFAYARRQSIPLFQAVRDLTSTEELKPRIRKPLTDLIACFDRWSGMLSSHPHNELAEIILEESGYTDHWKRDRSADAAGRLENLKELVRSMEEFESMRGFLEHVSLVMEAASGEAEDRVSLMTLHQSKGMEFETVFLSGWEEGLFPNKRALDEQGRAGLEEERRLAYVGITRGKRRVRISFSSNRRLHGSWNATIPSRFVDELPETHVEVLDAPAQAYAPGGFGQSRFDRAMPFQASSYGTPGWQRAQARGGFEQSPRWGTGQKAPAGPKEPMLIEGELIARSSGDESEFRLGHRVFHIKFGNGTVSATDGNKITVDFDHAGRKMVVASYLKAAGRA